MSSVFQSFQSKQGLPLSRPRPDSNKEEQSQGGQSIRRRLSSLSLNIQLQPISSSPVASWAFHRSKSVSSMGEYAGSSLRNWWDKGWAWILSRKSTFARDLEMNEEETAALGCHNKGSWRHVFYKLKSELRKLMGSHNVGLPQTFRYDSYSYSKNFDDAKRTTPGHH